MTFESTGQAVVTGSTFLMKLADFFMRLSCKCAPFSHMRCWCVCVLMWFFQGVSCWVCAVVCFMLMPAGLCVSAGLSYSGAAADVWAMGVLLFALVTGKFPWVAVDAADLSRKV